MKEAKNEEKINRFGSSKQKIFRYLHFANCKKNMNEYYQLDEFSFVKIFM